MNVLGVFTALVDLVVAFGILGMTLVGAGFLVLIARFLFDEVRGRARSGRATFGGRRSTARPCADSRLQRRRRGRERDALRRRARLAARSSDDPAPRRFRRRHRRDCRRRDRGPACGRRRCRARAPGRPYGLQGRRLRGRTCAVRCALYRDAGRRFPTACRLAATRCSRPGGTTRMPVSCSRAASSRTSTRAG